MGILSDPVMKRSTAPLCSLEKSFIHDQNQITTGEDGVYPPKCNVVDGVRENNDCLHTTSHLVQRS